MADNSLLAAILSGQDPLAAQMLGAVQGNQLSGAALDPNFGHNEGLFGALAKTIAGFRGGGMTQDALQGLVAARNANRPELARILASPDPFKAVAEDPSLSALTQAGVLNGATPNTVAEARQHAAQAAYLQAQGALANAAAAPMPPMFGNGIAALGAAGTGGTPAAATNADTVTSGGSGDNWEVTHNNLGGMRIPGSTVGPKAGGFQAFASAEDGVAAISHQLDRYASGATTGQPLTTIRQIVSTWAPPSENPTAALIQRASQVVGVDPDAPLDVSDPGVKAKLIEATIRNEQGGKLPVDPGIIAKVAGTPNARAMTVGGAIAPAGGQMAQAGTGQPQSASPPPGGPAAAPGGMPPGLVQLAQAGGGGQINPAYIAEAQRRANMNAALGRTTPAFMNEAGSLPFAGPKAQLEAGGKAAGELPYVQPKAFNEARGKLLGGGQAVRQGETFGTVDENGNFNPKYRSPLLPPGAVLGPGGEVAMAPGASKAIAAGEALKDSGKDDAQLYKDYRAMYLSNQSAKQDLTNAMEALQYVRSGRGAPMTNEVAKFLRAANVDVSKFVTLPQPAQLEIVNKASGRLLGGAVKSVVGGNRPALGEFDYLKNTVVNEETEPEAQRSVAAALLSTMNWQDALFTEFQAHKKNNGGSPAGFDVADFGKRNPMPQYFNEAVSSFAPLKGEVPLPQHPGIPAGPAAGQQPAPRNGVWNPKTNSVDWQ